MFHFFGTPCRYTNLMLNVTVAICAFPFLVGNIDDRTISLYSFQEARRIVKFTNSLALDIIIGSWGPKPRLCKSRLTKTAQGVFGAFGLRFLLLLCSLSWQERRCQKVLQCIFVGKTHHIRGTIYHPIHFDLKLEAPSWCFPPNNVFSQLINQSISFWKSFKAILAACHQIIVAWLTPTIPEMIKNE